jgi:hypothetical protein
VISFPQVSPPKPCIHLSSIYATCNAHLILDLITRIILIDEYRSQLLIVQFSSLLCHLIPLKPKYAPPHRILKHPHTTFLPQCARPCFTPIQKAKL